MIGPVLGHVTASSARVFIRIDQASPAPIVAAAEGTSTELRSLPGDGRTFAGDVPLPAGSRSREIRVTRGGATLGVVHARAAEPPADEGPIAFAFGSCWNPARVRDSDRIWRDLACLARGKIVDHLLLLGDQMYADEIPLTRGVGPGTATATASSWALALGASAPLAERVAPFRAAFERACASPGLAETQALLPTTCAWDDHEIVNSYGSHEQHFSPDGQALFEAASAAFDELQGSRNPPPLSPGSKAWAFTRGPASFLALDLRTHRRCARGRILGDEQRRAVRDHLEGAARASRVLFVATSVPLLHLPRIVHAIEGVGDVRDQWEIASKDDRAWLVQRLLDFEEGGRRRAILLGGDSHAASAAYLVGEDRRPLWQVVSSPLAQRLPPLVYPAVKLLGRRFGVSSEGGTRLDARIVNRWSGRNFGVVRGSVDGDGVRLAFELYRPGLLTQRVELISPLD